MSNSMEDSHFGDVLPSQSLGAVLKKLDPSSPTQEKQNNIRTK